MSEFVSTLLKWIIGLAAVALILWILFNPTSGKFGSLSRLVLGLETNIPNKEEPIITKQPNIPQDIINSQNTLMAALKNSLAASPTKNLCLVKVDLAGLQNYGLSLVNNNGIISRIITIEKYGGNARSNPVTIANAKLCLLSNDVFFGCVANDPKFPCLVNHYIKPTDVVEIYPDSAKINGNTMQITNSFIRVGKPENLCIISEDEFTSGCDNTNKVIGKGCINELVTQNKLSYC